MELVVDNSSLVADLDLAGRFPASTLVAFLVGALTVFVYFKRKPVHVLTLWVTRHGEKFHVHKDCSGLTSASTTTQKTQCLVCCSDGLLIL